MNREVHAAIFGNEAGQIVVFELDSAQPRDVWPYQRPGFFLAGYASFINGQCSAKCEPSLAAIVTMCAASYKFAHLVAARLNGSGDNPRYGQEN